jgi:hypothetical protein
MSATLLEAHAREKLGEHETWRVFRWHSEWAVYTLTGKRVRCFTRGPRKGAPNWKTPGESRSVHITRAEHDDWCKRWSQRTGLCARCSGTGNVLRRWSRQTGTEYRPCPDCNGTGKS